MEHVIKNVIFDRIITKKDKSIKKKKDRIFFFIKFWLKLLLNIIEKKNRFIAINTNCGFPTLKSWKITGIDNNT